ncbi:hypothetical protein IJH89_00345 [Candidatus Saccharibacteria bacterium]|nr:hypothetical protein [Candidatus Saccharibacteria bacterium]
MTATKNDKKPSSSNPKPSQKPSKKAEKTKLSPCGWLTITALPIWVSAVLIG